MAMDWCVCNIGTGHSGSEPDNILVRVFGAVKAGKINDGVGHKKGDLIGNVFGHGLGDRVDETMASIPADARRVFLVGHSRGAILSSLVANALAKARPTVEVHMFSVDPVARYASGTDDKSMVQANVRSIKVIVMENDNMASLPGVGNLFQLSFVKAPSALPIEYIPMPGTHGTATQVNAQNPVGRATFQMILRWLDGHGVPLNTQPLPPRTLSEYFFEIHEANAVQGFTTTGAVGSRSVTDWDSSSPAPKDQAGANRRTMLAGAGISNPHTAGGGDRFANAGLFVNAYHADLFHACYPVSQTLVSKTPDQLSTFRITPGVRASLTSEIRGLRAYRTTWKTLTALGMANRLERLAPEA